jgi:hypothetical protein
MIDDNAVTQTHPPYAELLKENATLKAAQAWVDDPQRTPPSGYLYAQLQRSAEELLRETGQGGHRRRAVARRIIDLLDEVSTGSGYLPRW